MRQNTQKTTITKVARQYSRSDLLELLFPDGFEHIDRGAAGVQVSVHVPGCGDWSHQDLFITDETPLDVYFTMTMTEES